MARQGFKGQWVAVAPVRKLRDSNGVDRDLTPDYLAKVVANYNATASGEAPAVIGHPEENAPAYGWVEELRLNGEMLEAKFADTDDNFEAAVEAGRYKKRSGSFYLDPPMLRHIGFFGAQPVAAKGMPDIKFAQFADGEFFTVEETFNLQETQMKEEDFDQLPESFWAKFKTKLGIGEKADLSEGGTPAPLAAQFSEASVRSLITEAITTVTAEFQEKLDTKDQVIADISKRVDGQVAGSTRSEIAAFMESIPAANGKFILKNMHFAEFLESLAAADAADAKASEAICFSEGEGDAKVETKTSRFDYAKKLAQSIGPIVQFGEHFANLNASPEADAAVNPERVKGMKEETGTSKATGGKD